MSVKNFKSNIIINKLKTFKKKSYNPLLNYSISNYNDRFHLSASKILRLVTHTHTHTVRKIVGYGIPRT